MFTFCKSYFSNLFQNFVNKLQGTNNEGPSDDVEPYKYCAAHLEDIGYDTIRPPKEEFAKDWGLKALETKEKGGEVI